MLFENDTKNVICTLVELTKIKAIRFSYETTLTFLNQNISISREIDKTTHLVLKKAMIPVSYFFYYILFLLFITIIPILSYIYSINTVCVYFFTIFFSFLQSLHDALIDNFYTFFTYIIINGDMPIIIQFCVLPPCIHR